jgi:hypothetical protein
MNRFLQGASFANKVALAVVLIVFALLVVLFAMRHSWFDNPSVYIERRVDILAQLLVALGTGALAVVTWASVYETQQVVAGDDLRFRQSRMPSVKILATERNYDQLAGETHYRVTLYNQGDGPARNVRLWLSATVTIRWNKQGLGTDRDQVAEEAFNAVDTHVSSYLQQGYEAEVAIPLEMPEGASDGPAFLAVSPWIEDAIASASISY